MSFLSRFHEEAAKKGLSKAAIHMGSAFLLLFLISVLCVPPIFLWSVVHPTRHPLVLLFTCFAFAPSILAYALSKTRVLKDSSWLTAETNAGKINVFGMIQLSLQIPIFIWAAAWIAVCYQVSGRNPANGWQEYVKTHSAFTMLCGLGPQVCLAFWLSTHGHPLISVALSILLARMPFSSSYSGLQVTKGLVHFLGEGKVTNSPASILANALIFSTSFACIHLNISLLNSAAYNGLHGWQDALYFSVVTLATVGYGDIYPISHLARWASAIEICAGFIMLVIAVNASLTAWMQTHQTELQEATDTSTRIQEPMAPPAEMATLEQGHAN